jgi:hypothetical protein
LWHKSTQLLQIKTPFGPSTMGPTSSPLRLQKLQ